MRASRYAVLMRLALMRWPPLLPLPLLLVVLVMAVARACAKGYGLLPVPVVAVVAAVVAVRGGSDKCSERMRLTING